MGVGGDGRTARAERTRRAVVDALLALFAEGDLRPTGERIAERAGVSLRALWTNFADLDTLHAAAGERHVERQRQVFRPPDPGLPLAERVSALCRQRTRMLESLAPVARALALREPFSPRLRDSRRQRYRLARTELAELFAAELAAARAAAGSADELAADELLAALLAATTWPAWSVLRDDLGLSVPAARAVMRRTVSSLVSPGRAGPGARQ